METFDQEYDEPIAYFPLDENEANEPTNYENKFSSIFLGCPKPIKISIWMILAMIVGVYFITTFYIANILLIPMQVEGSSMYPTLNYEYTTTNNSYASDVVYLWQTQNVKYGDIVVFNATNYDQTNFTNQTELYYIKRVIATAGDTLQFKRVGDISSGYTAKYVLYKNGELLDEPYIAADMLFNVMSERFSAIINEEIIVIPEGYVYLMGDNRNNSKDSREIGLINVNDIVGKVCIHVPYGNTLFYGILKSLKNEYLF